MDAQFPFKDGVLQVSANEPAKGGVLENPRIEHLGDKPFVVGELASRGDENQDVRVGLTFWFPVEDVYMLTEFPNLKVAQELWARREAKKQPKRKGFFG